MGRPATGGVRYRSGRWWARITVHGREVLVEIEPPLRSKADKAKAQAEARALSQVAREKFAKAPPPPEESAKDWFDRWLQAKTDRGQASVAASRSHVEQHILPVVGTTPIASVTTEQVERIVQRLDQAVASGKMRWKTASNIWSTLSKAFKDAQRSKVLELRVRTDNPAENVQPPDRGVSTEKVHLYPSEFLQLVSCETVALERRRYYAIGIYNYMRPGELEALRWNDVDLARETIQIRRGTDDGSPKAGRARLPFDLEPEIVPLLRAMHEESGGRGEVIGKHAEEGERAEQLRADLLSAGVTRRELHERSDDPPREWLTAHDLRTTGITWMAVRGDPPLVIMARAGHATVEQTRGYVDAASLVRRGYGAVFPPLPAALLARRVSGHVSGQESQSDNADAGFPGRRRSRLGGADGDRTHDL